ncbi:FliG C-terminal domain-containing protein [Buchnera aphidicola]|uniref:Flagellar motor switch protein FliG n=1 Tax=Buchnera aphidicola subsp. Melaphis rhois TaxID=118103 RepID=A0A4D6YAC2_BUCMH|nr:FliG C-terminal domain-containing protein [Buchnera aphidicola]QCI23108.1 hypothetical protein D9V73_00335 [Buchnera aphidicola (Melaphis rhois)]
MINLDGIRKSAILLITVGIDKASEILKELSYSEIQDLIKCMFNLKKIPRVIVDQVISEFNSNFSTNNSITVVNTNYVIALSKKVLGDKNAKMLFNEIKDNKDLICGIKQLNTINPKNISDLIKHEHPQIIATMLIYLNCNQSSAILSYLEEQLSLDVISRIVQFTSLKRSGEHELIKIINYLLNNNQQNISNKGGIKTVIKLLKLMTYDQEQRIINRIGKSDKALANVIKSKILLFEDIVHLDDIYIKNLIKKTTLDDLSVAISASNELLKEKVLKNMSQKDSDYLKNYFSKKVIVSKDIIKEKQNSLLNIIKNFLK